MNPRSRTGSDQKNPRRLHAGNISIHAPAQGATSIFLSITIREKYFNPRSRTGSDGAPVPFAWIGKISIHAPAQGATVILGPNKRQLGNFNPRSRTGSDPESWGNTDAVEKFQSTLPHRERPSVGRPAPIRACISIHAPAQGATFAVLQSLRSAPVFQSTLPHRERPQPRSARIRRGNFNPRSRTGSDIPPRPRVCGGAISIHAPAQGATPLPPPDGGSH